MAETDDVSTRRGRPVRYHGVIFLVGPAAAAVCAVVGAVLLLEGAIGPAALTFAIAAVSVAVFFGGRAYALNVARQGTTLGAGR